MSIPGFLSSSYQQYKQDTNVFTTWLHQAARACGYNSATTPPAEVTKTATKSPAAGVITAPSQRLKGKARKLAKQSGASQPSEPVKPVPKSTKYKVTAQELLQQVEVVAKSTKKDARLPGGIQSVLQRAISARQRCAIWYAQSGGNIASNKGHQKFIEMLQNALNLLKMPSSNVKTESTDGPSIEKLSNQFSALDVDDVDDEFPMTPVEVSIASAKPSSQASPGLCECELDEAEWSFEDVFEFFCFFEDLHQIQDGIHRAWQRFARGEISLEVTTVITHAGIDVARRLEKEMLKQWKDNEINSKHPYVRLSLPPFYAEAFARGENPDELLKSPKMLEHRPFHDFIYLPTALTLMKFTDVVYKLKDMAAWPFPIPQMRFSYISRPELLELPGYRKREEADELLTQLLLDVFMIEDMKSTVKKRGYDDRNSFPDMEDDFTKSARSLWQTGKVSTSAVFTCQIAMDILDICSLTRKPLFTRKLVESGKHADHTMDYMLEDGVLDTREVRWLAKDQNLLLGIYQLIKVHIPNVAMTELKRMLLENNPEQPSIDPDTLPQEAKDAFRKRMIERGLDPDDGPTEEHKRNAEKLNLRSIRPNEQNDFFQTHNAFHCGALSLRLTISMEEAGVALANHHMSIFAVAHLYNALQQLGLTTVRWPEMERVIDLQATALFANDVPTNSTDFHRRMVYRTNFSGVSKKFDTKMPWKFRTGTASLALKQLLDNKDSVEHVLTQLENQIAEHTALSVPNGLHPHRNAPLNRRRQLKPAQLMGHLEEYLPIVIKDMQVNYVSLTKTCNRLMQSIKSVLQRELFMSFPVMREAGDTNDHGVLLVVLQILEANKKSFEIQQRKKDKSPFPGGVELQLARDAFETFFNTHLAKDLQEKNDTEKGRII